MRQKTLLSLLVVREIPGGILKFVLTLMKEIYSPLMMLIIFGGMFVTSATAQTSLQTKILATAAHPTNNAATQKRITELITQLGDEKNFVHGDVEFTLGLSFRTLRHSWRQDKIIWIMSFTCIGFAVVGLCLSKFLSQRFWWSTVDLSRILLPYALILMGFVLLYFGVHEIRHYRHILQDKVQTMGVVTEVERTITDSTISTIYLAFMDEQDVEHRFAMSWFYDFLNRPVVQQELPVIYYRPEPNLAVVDDFWATYFPPWIMLLIGTSFIVRAVMVLNRRIRIGTGKEAFIFGGITAAIVKSLGFLKASVRFLKEQSSNEIYYDEDDDQDDWYGSESEEGPFGEIDELPTTQSLISDLGNEDPMVRKYAAENLGHTGDKQTIKSLARALKDEDHDVCKAAKESLIQVLIKTLDDEDPHARAIAAKALGQIGGKRAIKIIAKALKDEDQAVRTAAQEGLALIKKKLGPDEWSKIVRQKE